MAISPLLLVSAPPVRAGRAGSFLFLCRVAKLEGALVHLHELGRDGFFNGLEPDLLLCAERLRHGLFGRETPRVMHCGVGLRGAVRHFVLRESLFKEEPTYLQVEALEPVLIYALPKNRLEEVALHNVNISKADIFWEVQTNYVNMRQLERKIPLMNSKVKATLENFELADGRYSVGLNNYVELQDALANYNNSQLNFVEAVFNYNVARETLLKSMGVR